MKWWHSWSPITVTVAPVQYYFHISHFSVILEWIVPRFPTPRERERERQQGRLEVSCPAIPLGQLWITPHHKHWNNSTVRGPQPPDLSSREEHTHKHTHTWTHTHKLTLSSFNLSFPLSFEVLLTPLTAEFYKRLLIGGPPHHGTGRLRNTWLFSSTKQQSGVAARAVIVMELWMTAIGQQNGRGHRNNRSNSPPPTGIA